MTKAAYYDEEKQEMVVRDFTQEEEAERISREQSDSIKVRNAAIMQQLDAIDLKTIRPLRDGEIDRVEALRAEAAALRAQLVKA